MSQLEKKVYPKWASDHDGIEKSQINYQIYNEIKDKATVKCIGTGYAHKIYRVIDNPSKLSNRELALICDSGNLCFGYRMEGDLIIIYTD